MKATSFVLMFLCLVATSSFAEEKSSSSTVTTTILKSPVVSLGPSSDIRCKERSEQAEMKLTDAHDGNPPKCIVTIHILCEGATLAGVNEQCLPYQFGIRQCLYQGECAGLDGAITGLQRLQSWVDGKSGIKK